MPFLRKRPKYLWHWQAYRNFFDISLLRYLMTWFALVPLSIVIFRDSGGTFIIKLGGAELIISLSLPFSWWVLWISSVAYVIALGWYFISCPKFVREYPSYAAYSAAGHSPRWLSWLVYYSFEGRKAPDWNTDMRLALIAKGWAKETDAELDNIPIIDKGEVATSVTFYHEGKLYTLAMGNNEPDYKIKDIFWEVFGSEARSKRFSRLVIGCLIIITWIGLVIVLAQNIIAVIFYVWG